MPAIRKLTKWELAEIRRIPWTGETLWDSIRCYWAMKNEPVVGRPFKVYGSWTLFALCVFAATLAPWCKYNFPGLPYMAFVLSIAKFGYGIGLPMLIFLRLAQLFGINHNKELAMEKFNLDLWRNEYSLWSTIKFFNLLLAGFGYVAIHLYVEGIFIFTATTMLCCINHLLRLDIDHALNQIEDKRMMCKLASLEAI